MTEFKEIMEHIDEVATSYYINCGSYKLKRRGYFLDRDKKDLVCEVSIENNKKFVTHLSSGFRIAEVDDHVGDKELLKFCNQLLEEKKAIVQERLLNINLDEIPEINSVEEKIDEFKNLFGFMLPYDVLVYGITGRYKLNIIDFENKILRIQKDLYNNNESLKWNIKNIYGDEALFLCNLFL